jgi:hypothetical protein
MMGRRWLAGGAAAPLLLLARCSFVQGEVQSEMALLLPMALLTGPTCLQSSHRTACNMQLPTQLRLLVDSSWLTPNPCPHRR